MFSAALTDLLAAFVLAGLAAGLAGYLLRRRKRLRLTLVQSFWYGVNYAITRILWRARVETALPVPGDQGAVIVSNHRSSIDPCFIEIATDRVVHWMVAKEYCTHWALGWFLRLAEVIPTNRGAIDTQSTKAAIRRAQCGQLVGVFPEGRINQTPQFLLPGRSGAALIALKARVPVIPCYISGSPYGGSALSAMLMPAKVTIRFGQPIDLCEFFGREDDRQVLEQLTRRFLTAVAALARQPDFQPEVAGRFARQIRTAKHEERNQLQ